MLRQIRQGGFTHLRVCAVNHVLGTRPDHLIEVIVRQDIQPIRTYGIKNDLGEPQNDGAGPFLNFSGAIMSATLANLFRAVFLLANLVRSANL